MKSAHLVLAVTLLTAALPLPAQQVQQLSDIQVTATRIPVTASGVPATVTVIDGEQLRRRGITRLIDALKLVPGATVTQSGSYDAVASIFLRGGESDFTKVLIDGVPINDPGGGINLADLSLDDVDRIEVVSGPTSVLYGADAMSGVIQIFTRRGSGALKGSLEGLVGSFGNRKLRGSASAGSGRFSASVAGSQFNSDGIYAFNNEFSNGAITTGLGWDDGNGGGVEFNARLGSATGHFPTDGNGDPVDRNQYTINKDRVLGGHFDRNLSDAVRLTVSGWSHRSNTRFRDAPDGIADSSGFGYAGHRHSISGRDGVAVSARWQPDGQVMLLFGGGLEHEDEVQSSLTTSNFGSGAEDQVAHFTADRVSRNVLAQLLWSIRPNLDLLAGGRYDHSDAFGGFGTVRGGVTWRPEHGLRVWGSVGTGFKAPTFSELFASTAFEVGNRELSPERSVATEFGIEAGDRRGRVGLTLFDQRFSDLIQYLAAAPGEPTYGNLQAARSRGLELRASYQPSARFSVSGHLTWLHTEVVDTGAGSSATFEEGGTLLRRPAWQAGLDASAGLGSVQATAGWRWIGSRDDVSFRDFPAERITLPSYGLIDIALGVPIPLAAPEAELLFRAENLFDARYEEVIGFPGRGRTLLGGARITF